MKHTNSLIAGFLASAALVLGAASAGAAAPALQGRLDLRPLTPGDIKAYGLTNFQGASGLTTIGVGQPAYLEAEVNIAVPTSDITNVTWTLTSAPIGSSAVITNSPLGANVPIYEPSDRVAFKLAGRAYLRPDMRGQYVVTVTIATGASGTTNVSQTINAGVYMGLNTCSLCHSGGRVADNIVDKWNQTQHAHMLELAIDGKMSDHYSKNCISCHTVGYDVNPAATNGGFDDVAKQLGWTFPAVLTNGNWAALDPKLKNLANIQCENCHGPGSEHAYNLGDTTRISKTFASGDCAQCHDSPNTHFITAEWNVSGHAVNTRVPSGAGRAACARCHTGGGFAGYADALSSNTPYTTNNADTAYTPITCTTCHDPHDVTNPHQLRTANNIVLGDGTAVTNAGFGGFCMNCHQSRNGSVTNSIVLYPQAKQTWAGGSSFGVHDSPVADMLEGVNGWTYGQNIPSSPHRSITNTCLTCHMQATAAGNPAFMKAGGHSFKMNYQAVSNGVTNTVDMVGACAQCHGPIDSFDMPVADYNGDGVIEGVQTEVQKLLNKLSTLLPGSATVSNGNYVADGLVKTGVSTKTNWPAKFLKAAYNWQFVNNDHSLGVHNAAYAVGLLKASIADLTGDANSDGLPDAWQIQYFGSATATNASPTFSAAGDGVPNWLKYALGLDPTKPGTTVTNGVVWANGNKLMNVADTNSVQIFTAAEVAFNTEVGKTYQIQAISSIGSGWSNVGGPIAGTGATISYVTPTRQNVKQFYRVITNP